MKSFLTNWKTTSAGVGAILAALADFLTQVSTKGIDPNRLGADLMGIITGIGLIMAKDGNVTGGTVPATPEAARRVNGK